MLCMYVCIYTYIYICIYIYISIQTISHSMVWSENIPYHQTGASGAGHLQHLHPRRVSISTGPASPFSCAKMPFLSCGRAQRHLGRPTGWCIQNGIPRSVYSDWLVVWNMTFIFPYIGNNHPNWLIFFSGLETTNQVNIEILQYRNYVKIGQIRCGIYNYHGSIGICHSKIPSEDWDIKWDPEGSPSKDPKCGIFLESKHQKDTNIDAWKQRLLNNSFSTCARRDQILVLVLLSFWGTLRDHVPLQRPLLHISGRTLSTAEVCKGPWALDLHKTSASF